MEGEGAPGAGGGTSSVFLLREDLLAGAVDLTRAELLQVAQARWLERLAQEEKP